MISIQWRSECANRGKLLLAVTSRTEAQTSHAPSFPSVPHFPLVVDHRSVKACSHVSNLYVTLVSRYRCFSYHCVRVVLTCRDTAGTQSRKGIHTDPVPSTTRPQGPLLYWLISLTRGASGQGLLSQPRGMRLPGIGTQIEHPAPQAYKGD